MKSLLPILATVVAAVAASSARASSTDWFETQGGSIRLVTAGRPDGDGRLRGMIDILLRPGWKTYWRDPGDSGVPPMLDVSKSPGFAGATIDFPAPQRHDEGDFVWMGDDRPVAFPVVLQARNMAAGGSVEAEIFLGVCETICIPVHADLRLDPDADPDNAEDIAAVDAAFAALPAPAGPDFGATVVSSGDGRLVVALNAPGNPEAIDFFIAGDENYAFGRPQKVIKNGKVAFSMSVDGPATPPASGMLHYTLTSASGSVSGVLPYF